MIFAGIDVGSLSTDTVLVDEDAQVVGYSILPTGASIKRAATNSLDEALNRAGSNEEVVYVVSTGYGRAKVVFAQANITEISCHAKGAFHVQPGTRTLIDIGGQDSKVIKIDDQGRVQEFHVNEKCAAGTGRFLEVMARALELDLDEMSETGERSNNAIPISSTCTVFAESEVVSLVAQEKPVSHIVRGLNEAIANRIGAVVERLGIDELVTMTGGVAKNKGVVRAIERRLGTVLYVPDEPQVVGALGAALFARERHLSGKRSESVPEQGWR